MKSKPKMSGSRISKIITPGSIAKSNMNEMALTTRAIAPHLLICFLSNIPRVYHVVTAIQATTILDIHSIYSFTLECMLNALWEEAVFQEVNSQ